MNFERTYQEWQTLRRSSPTQAHKIVVEAAKDIEAVDAEGLKWLATNLADAQRKLFIAAIYSEAPGMPEALYEPMMRAAVNETNPMEVQAFVEPCVKAFGVFRVVQTLMEYLEKGTEFEKAGAVNAMHWAAERKPVVEQPGRMIDPKIHSVLEYRRVLYLKTFMATRDLDLQRAIITHVDLDSFGLGQNMIELIEKVIKAARQHPDEYIKHRVEVQLKRSPSLYPLPRRKAADAPSDQKKSWWKQLWK